MAGVRSPAKNTTLKRLEALQRDNFYNPETGLELSEGETVERIHELRENKAARELNKTVRAMERKKTRSRGRPMIPSGQVVFRRIRGRIVPFRKKAVIGFD